MRGRKVESWQVMAVSDEFLKICKDMPEATSCRSVEIGGRIIDGPKVVMRAHSMQEIEQNLPAVVAQLTDADHTHLMVVNKSGDCYECGLVAGEDPNIPFTDCPHILQGRVSCICRNYMVDKGKVGVPA